MNKNKLLIPLLGGIALIGGLGAGAAGMASAQTPATTTSTVAATGTSGATTADVADTTATPAAATTSVNPAATGATATHSRGHMPIGQDGNITAINGSTITMQEESDEGGATFQIDASNATVTNNGATASLSSLAVGDKIFVNGTISGSNVAATSVSLGHPGGHGGSNGQ